ncbi:MAG: hypothetical protein J6R35_02425, partial [Clostridia bacterium]|nr:hypothetical protein [Clostridia bacterium]
MINRIILFLLSFCAFIPISLRFSYVIQSNNYRYVKSGKECFFSGVGLFVSLFIAFALHANSLVGSILCGISLSATAVITTLLYLKKRTKFKFTARGTRLYVAIVMTELLIKAITFFIEPVASAFITLLMVFCHGIIAYAVNGIIAPLERFRNRRYVVEGCQVLNKNSILKIGITGSYGKTSCKNILTELLKEKYQVIATEGNYNTPLGVLKTVNNYREELENADFSAKPIVFIAEMGAKRKGDIKELCDVVKPTHGIITGVNGQHLSTFKNIEGVYSTKKELADFIETYGGTVVFNGDNFYTLKMS